jgi:3-hexulose-6-phosphate synthase / 6-phospho-3-hexuloisomerase
MEAKLQLALDFIDLSRAKKLAAEAVACGVDWIEVGTPLIKSEGLDAVRTLRRMFPNKKIVADMKVMDTGRYEVEAAAKAGADVVVLLGVADDSTIKEAVCAAKNFGCEIMVDLINVSDMVLRAKKLESFGVDYICVHVGIDQQMRGVDPIKEVAKLAKAVKVSLAVAGGINSENAVAAIKAGASIIIVGGAITKAGDARKATSLIIKAMKSGKAVKSSLYKKYLDPLSVLGKVSTANLADAMHRSGDMDGIKKITGVGRVAGKAVTVRAYPGDWSKPVEAIDSAEKGDILVIDAGGTGKSVWGELASQSAKVKGVVGVVIDGYARDIEDIEKIKFPVFARGAKPAAGEPKGFGEINVPIVCGGVSVKPGDYIVCDSDGVVVVPKEEAVEIANRAQDVYEKEDRVREEIKEGSTLSKVLSIRKWEKTC